jgi:hypothetical protein
MPDDSGVQLVQDATVTASGADKNPTSRTTEPARDRPEGAGPR